MGHSDHRVLSRPCRVFFAGWESTTTRLQQAGWQLSAEQRIEDGSIRLALRFEPARLYMMAESQRFDFFLAADRYGEPPSFTIRHAASDFAISLHEDVFAFAPIDAAPQFAADERKSIEDFGIFATPLARTEEIIVEPDTVSALLEKIKAMQAPELAAVRERNRRRERDAPMQQQRFHAQILSLAA